MLAMRIALITVVSMTAGCNPGSAPRGCTPGQQVACACPGGAQGAQSCAGDGSGYGACMGCPVAADMSVDMSAADFALPDLGVTPDSSRPPDFSCVRQTVSFAPAVSHAAGTNPTALALGDVNGDGRPDVVVACSGSNDVNVLLDGAGGVLGGAVSNALGDQATAVAIHDLNGDGKPDLAVTIVGMSEVAVLLGGGNGGFAAPTNYVVGLAPVSVAVADFNGNGKPDLVVADQNANSVTVSTNDGFA